MASSLEKEVVPFGHWPSPITAELLSSSSVSVREVVINESTGAIYWIETRPKEDGRFAIMESTSRAVREVLPSQYSARATVNEMGGASFSMMNNGAIVFSDANTENVYRLDTSSKDATIILKAENGIRYADYAVHPTEANWILAVKEDHREATPTTMAYGVHNTLVAIDVSSQKEYTVASGGDFYSYPRFNADGTRVSWIQWSHPDMPWTGTTLYVADWEGGKLQNANRVAGEKRKESISQPKWSPDGKLFFASDKSGYWQLRTYEPETKVTKALAINGLEKSEFAIAEWRLGSSTYVILDSETIVASCVTEATSNLVLINASTSTYRDLGLPFIDLAGMFAGVFRATKNSVVVLGSTHTTPKSLVLVSNLHDKTPTITTIQPMSDSTSFDQNIFSTSRLIRAPRKSPGRTGAIPIFYFAPHSPKFQGPPDILPPGLIQLHGGPNGCTTPALEMSIQYWTSRGFAVAAVNYAGSTGFGREYCEELTGHWGLYDVQDTHDAVEYLKEHKLIDPAHVGVYGGSAGGYGTLSAIHMYPSTFQAAVSSYGISDIAALQNDSYKFESHDVERLILSSCDPGDEEARKKLYWERSPRYHVAKITAPLLLLQGTIDLAVPIEQAHIMVEQMKNHGRAVKIVEFEGEGHGWLMEANILRAFKETEAWWKEHLT